MTNDQSKAEQRATVEGPQGPEARKRAVWRLSPMVPRDLGWVFELAQPIAVVLIFIVSTGILYLRYFANGGHPVHGGSRAGNSFVFDPGETGFAMFYVFIGTLLLLIAALVWAFLAKRAGERVYADERAYADGLPFSVFGYPALLGEHEYEYRIDIYFADKGPDREKLTGLLHDIDGFLRDDDPEGRYCGSDGRHRRYIADYPKEDPATNAQRFVGTVRAMTGMLVTMNAQHPIDRIELTGMSRQRYDELMPQWKHSR